MANRRDLPRARQNKPRLSQQLGRLLLDSGVQAVCLHRTSHFLHRAHVPLLPGLLRRLNTTLTGADLHPGARLGKNVTFIHSVGIVIGAGAEVEDDCEIYGGVVLGGIGGSHASDGFPRVGRNSVICVGAKLLGPIKVGRDVTVGAGAVVLSSVPDGALVVGVPAAVKREALRS